MTWMIASFWQVVFFCGCLALSKGSSLLESFQRGLGLDERRNVPSLFEGRILQSDGRFETSQPLLADTFGGEPGFYHSVASGDPLADSIVIWTRYTPLSADAVVNLELRMAAVDSRLSLEAHLDLALNPNVIRTVVTVEPASDWVAKLDVTGLASGTDYVFAFSDGIRVSDIGTTHTAPVGPVDEFRYAVFSCSNFPRGYFHAYDVASTIEELDLWIHTGDYFYEGRYFHSTPGPRIDPILPKWEIVDLQDYRLRHASYVHGDEGLRNLRRSTPMMASWDDHETTNNSWEFGAENHQPICPVNRTSSQQDISQARCDRDEGDSGVRFQNAFQAYMEWLPIRYSDGSMGQIEGSFTQTIQWGDLATIIAFDTRTSFRSEDPTVGSGPLNTFIEFAFQYPDYTQYSNVSSVEYAALKETERAQRAILEDPQYTMLGDYVSLMEETFADSAGAGKPWQIFSANTMAGPHIIPDPEFIVEAFEDPTLKAPVRAYLDEVFPTEEGATLRGVHAMGLTQMTSNRDGFDGFSYERMQWMKIAEHVANNMIVLGGDVHDSYSFTLFQDGNVSGVPVAVNLISPGVTSTGLGGAYLDAFAPVVDLVGKDNIEVAIQKAAVNQVPGLEFVNYFERGFFAVSVTAETHTAEYFLFDDQVIQTDFETVRSDGSLTADFSCFASLETRASKKGSLLPLDSCGAITFQQERSALFEIPFPQPNTDSTTLAVKDCGMIGCSIQASKSDSAVNSKCRRRL